MLILKSNEEIFFPWQFLNSTHLTEIPLAHICMCIGTAPKHMPTHMHVHDSVFFANVSISSLYLPNSFCSMSLSDFSSYRSASPGFQPKEPSLSWEPWQQLFLLLICWHKISYCLELLCHNTFILKKIRLFFRTKMLPLLCSMPLLCLRISIGSLLQRQCLKPRHSVTKENSCLFSMILGCCATTPSQKIPLISPWF